MVSPGELRLLTELREGERDEFTPEIGDFGDVSYPNATEFVENDDRSVVDVMEMFAAQDLLAGEFVSKMYICPECSASGMQYTTACPSCESAHATQTTILEHGCGFSGTEGEFIAEGEYACPDCGQAVDPESLDSTQSYVCHDCDERFETPEDRLWCRDCLYMFHPQETTEQPLYRYSITDLGEQWLERHRSARERIAAELEDRRLDTRVDTAVMDTSGTERDIHVHAEDELLGERRIVAIYETPTIEAVEEFRELAEGIDAHPIIVTTGGVVGEEVASLADASAVTLLYAHEDGHLDSNYEVTENAPQDATLIQRLTSAVDVPAWKGQ